MKVVKFRIINYKSIIDSKDCYLDDKITILAGKNESGKTAILEALEDFNLNKNIRDDIIPLSNKTAVPEIRITIQLEKDEIKLINENFKTKVRDKEINLEIIKKLPNKYEIGEDYLAAINNSFRETKALKNSILEIISEIKDKLQNFPADPSFVEKAKELHNSLKDYAPQYITEFDENYKKEIEIKFEKLKKYSTSLNNLEITKIGFEDFIKKKFIPNFILFKTFEDILPNKISISEAPNNLLVQDLSSISNLNYDLIAPSADPGERVKHKDAVNIKFSKDYEQFWTQDNSQLFIDEESNTIYFWIKEGKEYYRPEIRSKGRQWHLAFYIKVTARSAEGKNNVILIDEPGLFLHAQAQKDILQKLEECANRGQLIFTTHSPYLIQSNKLQRLRLVIKNDKKGTKIDKITAKADKETLTPILTAIGEDLSIGIKVDKKNSIVVEGYSDYLYLISLKNLLNIIEEMNFVPAVGADSSIFIGSILFGWSLDPIFILDNDKKGKEVKDKLIKKLSIEKNRILIIPETKEGETVNLFSDEDREKFIEKDNTNYGKVLKATLFNQKVEKGEIKLQEFSKETKDNFEKLFNKLKELII